MKFVGYSLMILLNKSFVQLPTISKADMMMMMISQVLVKTCFLKCCILKLEIMSSKMI